jgi:hypothetical protein
MIQWQQLAQNGAAVGQVPAWNGTSYQPAYALHWSGLWLVGGTYALNEAVQYSGSAYISLQEINIGHQPDTSPTWWSLAAAAGAKGDTGSQGPQGATGAAGAKGDTGSQGPPAPCEGPIGDPGSSSPVLAAGNDSLSICANDAQATQTVKYVACKACAEPTCAGYAGSPVVDVLATGGTSILTSPLTCGAGVWLAGTLNGTPVVHSFNADGVTCPSAPCTLDLKISTADGVSKYLVIRVGRSF